MAEFVKQLHISRGITAIIGSGGKTTLMYTLAQELSACGSVIVTTTTHICVPEHLPVTERTERVNGIVCVGSLCGEGKLCAGKQSPQELVALADFVLVEADGSARRPIKAHAAHEPVIPEQSRQVICVVGASGLNRPIGECVHRPEIFYAMTGSDFATPEAVAKVLKKENLADRLVINQSELQEEAARELAQQMQIPTLLTCLKRGEILCSY